MPMKTRSVGRIPVHRRPSTIKAERAQKYNQTINHASGMIKNEKLSKLEQIIFEMIDKYTPFFNKHQKIGNNVLKLSEKILRKIHCPENNHIL